MKKRYKVLIAVIALIMLFFTTFITVDSIRAKNNREPVFAIRATAYDDGGSEKYIGLFYNFYAVHAYQVKEEWCNEDGTLKDEYEGKEYVIYKRVVPWFVSLDKVKKEYNSE